MKTIIKVGVTKNLFSVLNDAMIAFLADSSVALFFKAKHTTFKRTGATKKYNYILINISANEFANAIQRETISEYPERPYAVRENRAGKAQNRREFSGNRFK